MIIGINTIFEHGGKKYHLQAEDLGDEASTYEVRVYDEGSVVWVKRLSYAELKAQELPKGEHEQALRTTMEKTLLTVEAAITKGKIG
ncbi:MAG: hypothetical protein AAF560_08925 [Acidobacteriota bacterium]